MRFLVRSLLVILTVCACGAPRSGTDGGVDGADSGPLADAGAADAGASDAGRSDAGASDAGVADAGPVDAGLTDAGRPFTGWRSFNDGAEVTWVYVPQTGTLPLPAVFFLHGCGQPARSFATAVHAEGFAEDAGVVVAFPQQALTSNAYTCWSWWDTSEQQGTGPEVTRLVARLTALPTTAGVDAQRVYVAGISSGGSMASILGVTHPELVAGVAVHSGLAWGAATDAFGTTGAQSYGASDVPGLATQAYAVMGAHARPMPVFVAHGLADFTVAPVNGEQVAQQWRLIDDLADDGQQNGSVQAGVITHTTLSQRAVTVEQVRSADGGLWVERWGIDGVGHAWSGGDLSQLYTADGPDVTSALWQFFTVRAAH
jgi:poly(hydroxyalkanoate) depolymerase family esterase